MRRDKPRNPTAAMQRAMALTGIDDPCQLGGLQKLVNDDAEDCRVLDPSAGKFPAPAGEQRHWADKIEGYQRMPNRAGKSRNRSGHPRIHTPEKPTGGPYTARETINPNRRWVKK